MIRSFCDKGTRAFFEGWCVRRLEGFRVPEEWRLQILDSATRREDLVALPSNRLEVLAGPPMPPCAIVAAFLTAEDLCGSLA